MPRPLNSSLQLPCAVRHLTLFERKSMFNLSIWQRAAKLLAVVALLGFGAVMAQSEPSIKQIYEAAQSGKIDQAQVMVQQVLVAHPNSAKAHYVQAELYVRQGQASRGREALLMADKLAPGLPFAKPEAVQALRTQLASKPSVPAVREASNLPVAGRDAAAPASSSSSFPMGLGLALGGVAIAFSIFMLRKKPVPDTASQVASANLYANPNAGGIGSAPGGGLSGPQTFGTGAAAASGYAQAPGQTAYGQPPYGQPVGSGLGGRVMGGLATGLAVGAGVMAAQAIGKSLMGNNEHAVQPGDVAAGKGYEPLASNSDLGGQDFGVNDVSSWDDGSSMADSGGGGGGDWDS